MEGKLPQVPGERPTLNDWENHLGTIYSEVCIICASDVDICMFFKYLLCVIIQRACEFVL